MRPPSRPIALTSVADATPVMSSETTSGMTVIRMAFTHSAPTGAIESAAREQRVVPRRGDQHTADDRRAERDEDPRAFFHEESVMRSYIIRSPPLMSSDVPVM